MEKRRKWKIENGNRGEKDGERERSERGVREEGKWSK